MRYIENVVIGKPIIDDWQLLGLNKEDFEATEKDKTYYTDTRWLPRILVDLGIYPSTSEIRRNKPSLMITLDKLDFLEIKASRTRKLWIVVGE